jgi:RimJ/RimL family protein N-acetyltransferase
MFKIETKRIALRPFTQEDAPGVSLLANDWAVAKTLALVPHPYPEHIAAGWIATHRELAGRGDEYVFAITRKPKGELIGAISVRKKPFRYGSVGYWIGKRYWGKGYATEAVQCMAAVAFDWLNLPDLTAHTLADNVASHRVLEKSRFVKTGTRDMPHRDEPGQREFFSFRLSREAWEAARKTG